MNSFLAQSVRGIKAPVLEAVRSPDPSDTVLFGNRIPRDFFISKGTGESDICVHAGSYHLALRSAGIERCNIITYSSILPAVAQEVVRPDALVHGSVMETIMAVANSECNSRATAGIMWGWLHSKVSGERYGGLVCEYSGTLETNDAEQQLHDSLEELYTNGYSEDFSLVEVRRVLESFVPTKRFGTAVVTLCFLNYIWPVLESNSLLACQG
ncbi:MAG TPA: pyruvoyl-dependent arginine decarboxylase [Spirochaetia bacterium]|nr:pyruvoyl-dependent arginine decarboxylase [Spirochaetia bacterium]